MKKTRSAPTQIAPSFDSLWSTRGPQLLSPIVPFVRHGSQEVGNTKALRIVARGDRMGQNATEDRELEYHEGKGQQTIPQSAKAGSVSLDTMEIDGFIDLPAILWSTRNVNYSPSL